MFDPGSRYFNSTIKTHTVIGPDGEPREIRYVERRIVPPPGATPTLVEHRVVQGERLDQIAAKYIGDPAQFWRVADANEAMQPEDLTDEIGRRIIIALPQR